MVAIRGQMAGEARVSGGESSVAGSMECGTARMASYMESPQGDPLYNRMLACQLAVVMARARLRPIGCSSDPSGERSEADY